jgi:glycosyltransferase involved in cell wall biosynthesis
LTPALKAVDVVCANGDALTQVGKFLGDHAVELPVGLDCNIFKSGPTQVRERFGWTKKHWVIGYVGRLAYIKGVDLLAEAFKQMRRSVPHARLLVIGAGEEEGKLRSWLREELAEGVVHLECDVPHELLAEWYRAMDLFVMPSRYENYSNAVLEALACGIPFLVSDVGGSRHLAETKGGWFFCPASADSLKETLCAIAKNPCLTASRGAFGGAKVQQTYSWETSAKRLEDIFQSCLKREVDLTCRL